MIKHIPTLLIPGLMATPLLYAAQLGPLWRMGTVIVADHRGAETVQGIASAILSEAPPRFRLLGLSMGGYIAFEILRQAADRVVSLVLLDTSARPDNSQQSASREQQIALAHEKGMRGVADAMFPYLVHPQRRNDVPLQSTLREMAEDTGVEAFERQQRALIARPDSRPGLAAIKCRTLVIVGEQDQVTPPELAKEIAASIPRSQFAMITESGHLTTLERPAAVTSALAQFWEP
jgi:pimeloyl-ACP methyl ester carboxylesterase